MPGPGETEVPPRDAAHGSRLARALAWARQRSLTPLAVGLPCCLDRLQDLLPDAAPGPRQADLLIVAGPVNRKLAPRLLRLHLQMPRPCWVLALGACACGGGPWAAPDLPVPGGVDEILPVDVLVPGCPPDATALACGLELLEARVRAGAGR
jgi:NADH-quinone oxidoreductase subunit B